MNGKSEKSYCWVLQIVNSNLIYLGKGVIRTLSNIYDGASCKKENNQQLRLLNYFNKKAPSLIFQM